MVGRRSVAEAGAAVPCAWQVVVCVRHGVRAVHGKTPVERACAWREPKMCVVRREEAWIP